MGSTFYTYLLYFSSYIASLKYFSKYFESSRLEVLSKKAVELGLDL